MVMTEKLQPTSLTVAHLQQILSAVGGRPITEEMVRKDIESGAPVNPDGTINLIHYASWIVREKSRAN